MGASHRQLSSSSDCPQLFDQLIAIRAPLASQYRLLCAMPQAGKSPGTSRKMPKMKPNPTLVRKYLIMEDTNIVIPHDVPPEMFAQFYWDLGHDDGFWCRACEKTATAKHLDSPKHDKCIAWYVNRRPWDGSGLDLPFPPWLMHTSPAVTLIHDGPGHVTSSGTSLAHNAASSGTSPALNTTSWAFPAPVASPKETEKCEPSEGAPVEGEVAERLRAVEQRLAVVEGTLRELQLQFSVGMDMLQAVHDTIVRSRSAAPSTRGDSDDWSTAS